MYYFSSKHLSLFLKLTRSLPLSPRHYWDYTREAGADLAWDNSPVFGDQWFGSNAPANGDHVVDTGRFAYTPVTPTLQLLFL
jgi:hypothetical protein